jgi:hypothetical protein|tara:strand:- start:108 stop:473 length:366 start_codon:yes stop_codon:yes gene_type:complete
MNYFAKVENNIVTSVIVAEQDFINSGAVGHPSLWIQTSIDGSFRKRYAGIGYTYDKVNDVFISITPFASWTLDDSFDWQPPTPKPDDGKKYEWDEDDQAWIELELDLNGIYIRCTTGQRAR